MASGRERHPLILILGAGIAGLSASYHLGHHRCLMLEQCERPFGHAASEQIGGFTWDLGPHVSFTRHDYVRGLFDRSVNGRFAEFKVHVGNYYAGHWIDHPAQTSLYQVPEPLRSRCLESFLATRAQVEQAGAPAPRNYREWLERAFGPVFAENFPGVYTRKYWTRSAADLTTDWIGNRILYPKVGDVEEGAQRALDRSMHYITSVRYPLLGGYQSFAAALESGSRIEYGASVVSVDLENRTVRLADGRSFAYSVLINTLPLPTFVSYCVGAPPPVMEAGRELSCTQLLLVNVAAPHPTLRPEHWAYVYDDDKLTTRVNCTEKLSPHNAPEGWTGVQAEVYHSRHRPLRLSAEAAAAQVEDELIEMGLLDPSLYPRDESSWRIVRHAPWANVIFDHETAPALETIWDWLENFGLARESDDLSPLTDWERKTASPSNASIFMAGRFGQWKYFWSDDCVLRGRYIAEVC